MSRQERRQQDKGFHIKDLLSTLLMMIVAVGVGWLLQHYVVAHFEVSGQSMSPTLQNGEHMFMYRLASPNRFDIVIIKSPDETYDENGKRKLYIKRVIGMPGDYLEYKNDTLYINGTVYEEKYLDTLRTTLNGKPLMSDITLPEILQKVKAKYPNLPTDNTTLENKDGTYVIPAGHYFVLGDNRRNSKDGDDFGLTNENLVEGIAVLRFLPFSRFGISPFQ